MYSEHLLMRSWWVLALRGLAAIAFGVITLALPGVTVLSLLTTFALIVMIGVNALISGVFDIVLAIRLRKAIKGEWLLVLNAIISIIFGILVLAFPAAGTFAMIWMIGVYALLTGILLLSLAWRAHKLKKEGAFGSGAGHKPA